MADQHYEFTPNFIQDSFRVLVSANPNLRHTHLPANMVFLNRLQWGLYAVLSHLKAKWDWQSLIAPLLRESGHNGG